MDLPDSTSPKGRDRAHSGLLDRPGLYLFAAVGSMAVLAAVIGLRSPSPPTLPTPATPAPSATSRESRPASSSDINRLEITAGLVGLPPLGAGPSSPSDGELLDEWRVYCCNLPYRGSARLYYDGRLIWNRYYGPQNSSSTGYLEQRLTPNGVQLVLAEPELSRRDPAKLRDWLPDDAWQDPEPGAYVPSHYAACISDRWPEGGATPAPHGDLLELLPPDARDLLRTAPARDDAAVWDWADCRMLTSENARLLDGYLRSAGFDQDPVQNRYLLEYEKTIPDDVWDLVIDFEPVFPDGTIGCSSCG